MGPKRENYEPLTDWSWFAPIILAASRQDSSLLGPQLVSLVGDYNSRMEFGIGMVDEYRVDEARLDSLFGADANEVLRIAAALIPDDGDKALEAAVEEIRIVLARR